uniref:hypothetical protein n=1 Tax=Rhizobium rhizogenes TaxID=359 RepID=UPI001AED2117|nr:hypothetical protein [Rhizobium rhizogenes]
MPGRRDLPEIYLTARLPWLWRYAAPVVTGGIRPGLFHFPGDEMWQDSLLSYALPSEARDDLNIRPARQESGGPLYL